MTEIAGKVDCVPETFVTLCFLRMASAFFHVASNVCIPQEIPIPFVEGGGGSEGVWIFSETTECK